MKFTTSFILAFALYSAIHAQAISKMAVGLVPMTVIRIWDGDSFVCRDTTGKSYEIRLARVDCPEILGYSTRAQPYSSHARDSVKAWLRGAVVFLDTLTVKGDVQRDVYGRLIADVYLNDAQSLQFKLIENGLAWYEPLKNARSTKLSSVLNKEMAVAKSAKRGLWASYLTTAGKIARIYRPSTWRARYSRV